MSATASTHERWVNPTIYTGVCIVAVYCVGVSGYWLIKLAAFCSMHGLLGLSVPFSLDAAGGIAAIVWVKGTTKQARNWGAGIALGTLAGSLAGNILAHLIEAGIVKITPWLIIGVGSIPPIMLFLSIHLMIVFSNRPEPVSRRAKHPATTDTSRGARPPAAARETTAPASSTPLAAGAAPAAAAPTPPATGAAAATKPESASNVREIHPGQPKLKDQGKAWFLAQVAAGSDPDGIQAVDVDRAIGATEGYCKKHIQHWRAEVAAQSAVN